MEWDRLETPLLLARALWSFDALELSPSRFKELFDNTYCRANDLETLWQLGGAINDYLRRNPAAMSVPSELPWQLLQSDNMEARVIGLKLLNRCHVPDTQCIDEFIRAIQRNDGYESDGGLCELGQFLERRRENGVRIPVMCAELLKRVLRDFPIGDDDNYRRWMEHLAHLAEAVCR